MILACDGIWNFMSNEEVVQFVNKRIHSTQDGKLSTICEEVLTIYFPLYFVKSDLAVTTSKLKWFSLNHKQLLTVAIHLANQSLHF